jgi:hypothetical protein
VQQLDIVEDLLDEDHMMVTIVRQGWTLAFVFGVGWSDGDAAKKNNFENEEMHSHELGTMIELATQSVQGTRESCVWRHGRVG